MLRLVEAVETLNGLVPYPRMANKNGEGYLNLENNSVSSEDRGIPTPHQAPMPGKEVPSIPPKWPTHGLT